ncbi:MAG: hypothetical protein F6K28_57870 [Microcoleus sp. SIO2G3]|nr:hypothetical protein [Microcoleus sp. SIO2G3]
MPDITTLNQTAADSDRLAAAWVNAVRNKLADLDQQLAYANQQINSLKSQISQAFRVTQLTGLTIQYASGQVKLPSGVVVTISSGTLTVPASSVSYLWVSDTGAVQLTTTRPVIGLEIARIVSNATTITEIQNYPIFEVRTALPSLDEYATRAFAESRAWQLVAIARKTTTFSIPSRDTYHRLTWESLSGTGWNTGGTFTAPVTGKYIFHPQIRIDSSTPASSPDVSGKMSLFLGTDEYNTALQQGESAADDLVLNASNAEPAQMNQGDTASIRVYITTGTNCRVREKSLCQVWRINQ